LIMSLTPILTSCATTMGSSGTDPRVSQLLYCDGAKPIRWSSKDTDQTIREAKEQNAVGKAECGWK
jgi:hypothetical protein